MEAVVAAQRSQSSQPNGIGEEDLGASIDPDLGCKGGHQQGREVDRRVPSTQYPPALPTAITCASANLDQSGFR